MVDIGLVTAAIAVAFPFSPLGHAERYLPTETHEPASPAAAEAVSIST
jgi:hypothetical protein